MGSKEMLQRSITYEEALLRNYLGYSRQTDSTEIGDLFEKLAEEKSTHIDELKTMLEKFCTP
jgi:rubrerythrin